VKSALANINITKLYSHQAESLTSFRKGENVVVATPTASGKSLIYNLALVELLSQEGAGHGLYLFPLKALAQDQYQAFVTLNQELPKELQLEAAVYDGDTSPSQRRRIKENLPNVIISNPDMLHLGFLPFHQQWESFFRHLRLVVKYTHIEVFLAHMWCRFCEDCKGSADSMDRNLGTFCSQLPSRTPETSPVA